MSDVFSVRMRAAIGESQRHVSGCERLVAGEQVDDVALELLRRARAHNVSPDAVMITIERIAQNEIAVVPCLPIDLADAEEPAAARREAGTILSEAGISSEAVERGFAILEDGDGYGSALRGAALLDIRTGDRLDHDAGRGIRASRFDYSPTALDEVSATLAAAGLAHFRTREALALATKVIWSGVVAEICWSDDPAYVAGYVATAERGYVRFPQFKPADAIGGRAFFVETQTHSVETLIDRLECHATWISGPIVIKNRS